MAFTSAQLADIRRFCGYPAFGNTPTQQWGIRWFTAYANLEYKLQNLSTDEQNVVTNTYLTNLYTLETDIFGVRSNLDTESAAVWTHNKNELSDRLALFTTYRRGLADFLGTPPGPGLNAGGMRIVV